MEPIEQQLTDLIASQAQYHAKAEQEIKTLGATTTETAATVAAIQKQVDALDKKLADKHVNQPEGKGFTQALKESEQIQRLMKDRSGVATVQLEGKQVAELFERKTTITSADIGSVTAGVMPGDRRAGIVAEARQALMVRDVLSARPTTQPLLYFVKVNAPLVRASPQHETVAKHENAVTFTVADEQVRTIATWIPAARQIMDDFAELEGFLRSSLPYYVNLEEEIQLLSGDGAGQNLNGLITQATAFNTALLVAADGWNRIDIIGRAIQQITAAKELVPTFVILHPNDWWSIRLTKDSQGRYIFGDPQAPLSNPNIFGLTVVSTTSITSGTFLIGSGNPAASEIRDRMAMDIQISTEHSDYFTRNMVAIRAEKRLALVVYRPASYIKGTFTTSP
jgi:HK97 family phage major capsid protein